MRKPMSESRSYPFSVAKKHADSSETRVTQVFVAWECIRIVHHVEFTEQDTLSEMTTVATSLEHVARLRAWSREREALVKARLGQCLT